jgi:AraC-like DNA-binding protein
VQIYTKKPIPPIICYYYCTFFYCKEHHERKNSINVDEKTIYTPSYGEGTGESLLGGDALFLSRFKEVVEARLTDSDVSVEDLAANMNLSRVQLYRKIKSITGSSPVEILRNARLNRAYQLLLTTDKSVSEVAYAVGFTAPSYFTKCFKDEYGKVPGDVRK